MAISGINYSSYQGLQNLISSTFGSSSTGGLNSLLSAALSNQLNSVGARLEQTQTLNSLQGLNRAAMDVRNTAAPLSKYGTDSVFNARGVTTGDEEAVTGTAKTLSQMRTFDINVNQIAQAQTVASNRVAGGEATAVQEGANQIKINAGGQDYNIDYTVQAGATNKQAMQAMAGAINQSGAPVTAKVVEKDTGEVTLQLTGKNTGAANNFTVTDVTGNGVAALNINTAGAGNPETGEGGITQAAQNARYSIDGGAVQESATNKISLFNNEVEMTLKKATGGNVDVTVGADTEAIANAVENFAAAYNKQMSFLNENQNVVTMGVQNTMQQAVSQNAGSLSAMGIEQNSEGELVVNRAKLEESITTNVNEVRDTFRGAGGVATEAYNSARGIVETPLNQTAANALSSLGNFGTYNNLGYMLKSQVSLSNFLFAQSQGFFINMLA